MSIVQLSFAAFTAVGLLSIIGIVVIVTGRGPKNLNWKKNVDKKALKEDKSQTNFLEPDLPKGETETVVDEIEEPVGESDGSVKLEEKIKAGSGNITIREDSAIISHLSQNPRWPPGAKVQN